MAEKQKDGFFKNVNSFFKRLQKDDVLRLGDGKVNSLETPKNDNENKKNSTFQIFRQYLQQKNYSLQHIELYDEYRKMDETFPIANAAIKIYVQEMCCAGDSILKTPQGDFTINELIKKGYDKTFFMTQVYDHIYKRTAWGLCKYIKSMGVKKVFKVTLEKNLDEETLAIDYKIPSFRCTENHKILLPNNTFKELKDLKIGDEIFSFYKYTDPSCKCLEDVFQKSKIISIEEDGEEEVYDLFNVEPHSHFSIKISDYMYAEVHNCSKGDDGNIIKINHTKKEVKKAVEECFFKNLKINSQGYLIAKEMLKFGNAYTYINARRGEGVIDLIYLPPEAIRVELLQHSTNLDDYRYSWMGGNGGGNNWFEPWEIVHFKIIEDIALQPYGTSILRSVVDTWRRIILMREALIIYRITRAPQRYLFKIDTSGLSGDEALAYADEVQKSLYKKPSIDPKTNMIDFKSNVLPVASYTPIPLLDGRTITIAELAKEFEEGKENYVYSINDNTKEPVAGLVKWCGKNYTAEKLIRVWLDNETYIDTAPEHPFIMRDGTSKRADELLPEDSLMPLYLDEKLIANYKNYQTIYNPSNGKYEFTHRLIAKESKIDDLSLNTIHHINFNRYNNRPDNLKWMNNKAHWKLHSSLAKENNKKNWANPEFREKQKIGASKGAKNSWINNKEEKILGLTLKLNDEIFKALEKEILLNNIDTQPKAVKFVNSNFKNLLKKINPTFSKQPFLTSTILKQRLKEKGFKGFQEFRCNILDITIFKDISTTSSKNRKKYFKNNPEAGKAISEANIRYGKMDKMRKILSEKIASGEISYKGINNGNYKGLPEKEQIIKILNENEFKKFDNIKFKLSKEFPHYAFSRIDISKLSTYIGISNKEFIEKYLPNTKGINLNRYEVGYQNHKVIKTEILIENTDVYCMSVFGPDNSNDRHNFACYGINKDGLFNNSGVFVKNSIEENLFMPTFDGDVGGVEVLQGASNMNDIEDYKIIKDDFFAGLLIPKSFLTFEESLCARENTLIYTNDGLKTIKEISDELEKEPKKKKYVMSCNEFGYITNGKILWAKPTKLVDELYKINLSNGKFIECTNNHPFLLENLEYKNADLLFKGDVLKSMFDDEILVSSIEITKLDKPEYVYDLEVEDIHNFSTEAGVFIHNSNKSALRSEDLRFGNAVKQYQNYFLEGLLHIAVVHLHLQGFSQEDIEGLTIEMNVSSAELKKIEMEVTTAKIQLAKEILDNGNSELTLMSFTGVLRDVLDFTDDDIKILFEEQLVEKKMAWRMSKIKENGFYEEPEFDKKSALEKKYSDSNDIFSKILFEKTELSNSFRNVLSKKAKEDVKKLLEGRRVKPNKENIKKILKNTEINSYKENFLKDIGLK